MMADRLDIDVGVGVLVEEDCTTCVMGHVEAIREPPRRGPGFQLWMLSFLCTVERVAQCLLELFL